MVSLQSSFIRAGQIIFLHIVVFTQISSARDACVSKHSQMGYALENSAYNSSLAENYPACLSRCLTDKTRCKSLSYDLDAKICELSEESRWSKHWEFKKKVKSIYMEMLGVEEVFNSNATIPSIITANAVSRTTTSSITSSSAQPPPSATASRTTTSTLSSSLPPPPPSPATAPGTTTSTSSSSPPLSVLVSGTTQVPIASSSVEAFDATSFCIGKTKYKYYSYPGDCHKYVWCTYSSADIKTCSDPLAPNFNPQIQTCDLASLYTCP